MSFHTGRFATATRALLWCAPATCALPLCLLLLSTSAFAQSTSADLDKYWALRDRLDDEFMVQGAAAGDSIPATYRLDVAGLAVWSDATVRVGWYLGVLATEHALLADPIRYPGFDDGRAGSLATTDQALGDALAALERLDNRAEPSFPFPLCLNVARSTNGFFIRDDVPSSFAGQLPGTTAVLSDGSDLLYTNKEESQDQAYHLLIGLSLVAHLVPAGTVIDGRDLQADAVAQASRIARHLAANSWTIRNPACNKDVERGADTIGYAVGIRKAIAFISGGAVNLTVPTAGTIAWPTLRSPLNPAYINTDNLHMAMAVIAIGDGYGADTLDVLVDLANLQHWTAYPLLEEVLHGPSVTDWSSHRAALVTAARDALDELPAGVFPSSPTGGPPAVHGWTTSHRYLRPDSEQYSGGSGTWGQRYPGLDCMLLHDLVYLADPTAWTPVWAGFDAPAAAVCVGDTVHLTARSGFASYAWTIDGAAAGTRATLDWTPSQAGLVDVALTVGSGGETDTRHATILVSDTGDCASSDGSDSDGGADTDANGDTDADSDVATGGGGDTDDAEASKPATCGCAVDARPSALGWGALLLGVRRRRSTVKSTR